MISVLEFLGREKVSVTALSQWYLANRHHPDLADRAIAAMSQLDEAVAWRALWILRRVSEERALSAEQLNRICDAAPGVNHWAWRLCCGQLLARTGFPESSRETLFPFLQECFADRRTIVRAWALSAMVHLQADAAYHREVAAAFREARKDRSPSMQARLRHLDRRAPRARARGHRRTRPI